jgi:hypothetical protein
MKGSKLFFAVFLLSFFWATLTTAQSSTDLVGFTWKAKQAAVEALLTAQSDATLVAPLSQLDAPVVALKFREMTYNNVRELIEKDFDVPTSILKGYALAIGEYEPNELSFESVDKTIRRQIFDEIVNIVKN